MVDRCLGCKRKPEMEGKKKGKPVTTSVPSISIRFNANAEEIEDFYGSDDEATEETGKEASILSEKTDTISGTIDSEGSPLRNYLPRIGKRSTSVDVSPSNTSQDASPPSDPWRFFTDIKGKITKSVEGKLTEYKNNKSSEDGSPKTSKPTVKDSKESSSLSDSEDISESSISRTCGIISTTEGVEMSSDDETPSLSDKDPKPQEKAHDGVLEAEEAPATSKTPEKRHIKINAPTKSSDVPVEDLANLHNLTSDAVSIENEDDIEDGVDVLVAGVTEDVENLNPSEDGLEFSSVEGAKMRESFLADSERDRTIFAPTGFVDMRHVPVARPSWKSYLYTARSLLVVLLGIILYFWVQFPVYLSGFLAGSLATLSFCLLYYIFKIRGLMIADPGCERAGIFEIPSVKEYAPLTKFEGWVNEYPQVYNPHSYHVSQTQSVYLKLQGNLLKVSHTRSKIPKRAIWNEPVHKPQLTHHRIYNLLGAKITILPEGLARRRRWSKKYPIGITLRQEQLLFTMSEDRLSTYSSASGSSTTRKRKNGKKSDSSLTLQEEDTPTPSASALDNTQEDLQKEDPKKTETILSNLKDQLDDMLEGMEDKLNQSDTDITHIKRDIARNEKYLLEDMEDDWKEQFDSDEFGETRLYFFGRTDREKEDWFRRFVAATHKGAFEKKPPETLPAEESVESISSTLINNAKLEEEYQKYMMLFQKTRKINKKHEQLHKQMSEELHKEVSMDMFWVNALVGRVLFDCMRDPDFTQKVKDRIQRKLSAIKLPYFINELIITELSLGTTPPLMHRAGTPVIDDRGLWIDLDFTYEGVVELTLNTKVNLLKLKDKPIQDNNKIVEMKNLAMFHSDVDDSAETSTDDEVTKALTSVNLPPPLDAQGMPIQGLGGTSNASKKFIRIVDRIADSKMFKAASEYKYIKKIMEGVSNTDLGLKVEVKALAGTLVLNIPPPPTDRVWMSFRPTPKLLLTAFPIVGERNITFMHVTSWIEQKLVQEFYKVLVIPNMEDLTIPVMCSQIPH